jgi:putative chitinase
MLTSSLLKRVFPLCEDPNGWAQALNPALDRYHINSRARICSFLAQTGYESGHFNRLVENLTFRTAKRLMQVWPRRFPTEVSALPYVSDESKLANFVYANRLGNGDIASGDGFKYRGRGIIQITGRSNYASAGKAMDINLIDESDKLLTKEIAAMAAAWFWNSRGLNELADDNTNDNDLEDFAEITRRINGGATGIQDRLQAFNFINTGLNLA